MGRAPSSGGKSRLIQALGISDGSDLRTALLRDTLAVVASIAVAKAVLYTPPEYEAEMQRLTPFDALFLAQRGATLGDRMRNGMSDLLACGFGPVVLIGADLPTLPAAYVVDALDRLGRRDESVVVGPSEDGGYYLIGSTRIHDGLFVGMPWGTADVLRLTKKAADALHLRIELLPPWYDVDHPVDLQRVQRHSLHEGTGGHFTRAWLSATQPAAAPASVESEQL
jgi:rSAM/selenodomain-associated transferase 1